MSDYLKSDYVKNYNEIQNRLNGIDILAGAFSSRS